MARQYRRVVYVRFEEQPHDTFAKIVIYGLGVAPVVLSVLFWMLTGFSR